jgi:glycosyltransferase involved in cell wall biosynthesis
VAQHRANKNLELLIRSFHHCRQEQMVSPDMQLVVVGACGPETTRLHALVDRLSLHEHVQFLMNQTDAEMAALYRDCELFISLADIEGFGLPVGEALLHCTRVLASEIPAHREIAGNNCEYTSLAEPRSIEKTAVAIQTASVRTKPSPEAFAHLSPSATAAQYQTVYQELSSVRGLSREVFPSISGVPERKV